MIERLININQLSATWISWLCCAEILVKIPPTRPCNFLKNLPSFSNSPRSRFAFEKVIGMIFHSRDHNDFIVPLFKWCQTIMNTDAARALCNTQSEIKSSWEFFSLLIFLDLSLALLLVKNDHHFMAFFARKLFLFFSESRVARV